MRKHSLSIAERVYALALIALLGAALCCPPPARAQMSASQTFVTASNVGGTANAITLSGVPALALSDLIGVPIRFMPTATSNSSVQANVNGLGLVNVYKSTNTGLGALVNGEIRNGQAAEIMYDGTQFELRNPLGQFVDAGSLTSSVLSLNALQNVQINATVGSNQLTIALKTSAGTDATSSNPIPIVFRDPTIANGDPVARSVTGALSFTINSGNTMGCTSGVMCRLWVHAIDNAGTVGLCAYNAQIAATGILGLDESNVQTSASGTSGGSSAQTLYCNISAVTSKSIRYLGYVDIQEGTAGTWASGPTVVQLFGPGIKKPGEVVKTTWTSTGAYANVAATNYTPSDTPPTTSVGTNIMSLGITPASAANRLVVDTKAILGGAGGGVVSTIFLTQDSGTSSLTNDLIDIPGLVTGMTLHYEAVASTSSSTTFKVWGAANGANVNFNGSGGRYFGGAANSYIRITEIQG